MAQTKTKSKKRSAPKRAGSSKSKTKSQSKPKAAKKAAKPKGSTPKSPSSNGSRSSNGNGSSGGTSPLEAVRSAVGKAKVPLVAGGAAIAGAAGGLALAASKQGKRKGLKAAMPRPPKIKIDSGDVAKAAKQVGNFSAQVGELANELQRARESADGRHRSPVEVVLQGLTARR